MFQALLQASARKKAVSIHGLKQLLLEFAEGSEPGFGKVHEFVRVCGLAVSAE